VNALALKLLELNEPARLRALDRYSILDTPQESDFDDIAQLASEICGTPIAVVNLVSANRQFFKAEVGLGVRETPLDTSFCGHAILQEDFMHVPDAKLDARFDCNPLVTGGPQLRFYAGALLRTDDGHAIGTLCVLDFVPRTLNEQQISALKRLARQVMAQLELRQLLRVKLALNTELEIRVAELTAGRDRAALMAHEVDHRVMNSLQFISTLLSLQSRAAGKGEVSAHLDTAAQRVASVARVHRHFYLDDALGTTCLFSYSKRLAADLEAAVGAAKVTVEGKTTPVPTTLVMPFGLIMNELVTNAAKYGARNISIRIAPAEKGVRFTVGDDGPGLPADFDPGARKGLGMTVVQALVEQNNGALSFESTPTTGTTFSVRIG